MRFHHAPSGGRRTRIASASPACCQAAPINVNAHPNDQPENTCISSLRRSRATWLFSNVTEASVFNADLAGSGASSIFLSINEIKMPYGEADQVKLYIFNLFFVYLKYKCNIKTKYIIDVFLNPGAGVLYGG
jgi:hypothetical protein